MKPSLLVLAAGIGSRFGGIKQVEPIGPNGEFLIDYSIYDARKAGFGKIIFIISKRIEADFRGFMESHYGSKADFIYAYQEIDAVPVGFAVPSGRTKPWGTGHAVLAGKAAIGEPFAVINADDYYGPRSFAVLCRTLEEMNCDDTEFAMVGFEIRKTLSEHGTVSRGVCTVENGYCSSVVEHEKIRMAGERIVFENADGAQGALDPRALVSMNCWGFSPRCVFPLLENGFSLFLSTRGANPTAEFYLPSVINNGLANRSISVKMLHSGEKWFGLTYKEDIAVVKKYIGGKIDEGVYPKRLF